MLVGKMCPIKSLPINKTVKTKAVSISKHYFNKSTNVFGFESHAVSLIRFCLYFSTNNCVSLTKSQTMQTEAFLKQSFRKERQLCKNKTAVALCPMTLRTDRQTDRQRDRETDRQTDRQIGGHTDV